ncbi:DUF106 domain-containing protein [archaeon]|jgi:uncharacterized membrane protein (DUF106 family)|nr:DUF106 domain-containing protein [archaeon]
MEIENKEKKGSFRVIIIFFVLTGLIAINWHKWTWLSGAIHAALDPSAGALLNWNLTLGMLIIVFIISLLTTLIQKYATDQKKLKELKKEQKAMQKEMKEMKDHPEKLMHLQKKQMSMMGTQMKLSMRTIVYTGIPFVLFFRWFEDFFLTIGSPKFFGFLGWFWFYFLAILLFSAILKKKMDVV